MTKIADRLRGTRRNLPDFLRAIGRTLRIDIANVFDFDSWLLGKSHREAASPAQSHDSQYDTALRCRASRAGGGGQRDTCRSSAGRGTL